MKDRDRCRATEVRDFAYGPVTIRCVEPRGHSTRIQPHTWMGKAFRSTKSPRLGD